MRQSFFNHRIPKANALVILLVLVAKVSTGYSKELISGASLGGNTGQPAQELPEATLKLCSNASLLFHQVELKSNKTFYWSLKNCMAQTDFDVKYIEWIKEIKKPGALIKSSEYVTSDSHIMMFTKKIKNIDYSLNFEFSKDCSRVLSAWINMTRNSRQMERRTCF